MDRRRRALLVVAVTAASLVSSSDACADIDVERTADATACPDTTSFASLVNVGKDAPRVAPAVLVRFEHTAHGYRSSVRIGAETERSLTDDSPSCDGLAEATALALKLALDSDVEPRAPVPPKEATPPAAAESVAVAKRSEPVVELSARSIFAFGLIDSVAPGAHVGASLLVGGGAWSIGLTGLVLPAQTRTIENGSIEISGIGGGAEGCGRWFTGRPLVLGVCARTEVIRLAGRAYGFPLSEGHARPLLTGTLLGRVSARVVGPLSVSVEAGAVLPIVRQRFGVEHVGVVYEPSLVAAMTAAGVTVDF